MLPGLGVLLLLAGQAPAGAVPAAAPTVAGVELIAPAEQLERLRRYVTLQPGAAFDPEEARRTVELLYATGEFEDVRVETRAAGAGIALRVVTTPAPLLTGLAVEGDRPLKAQELGRIARLRRGEPLWPSRLERAGLDAGLALAERGFVEAQVTVEARPAARGVTAVFRVRAGPRARVQAFAVEGADPQDEEPLRALARPRPGETWVRGRADAAAREMQQWLARAGRWRASVRVEESYDPGLAKASVRFRVDPGPLVSLAYQGERLSGDQRRELGSRLRETGLGADVLEEGAERLEAELRARGHRTARVTHAEEQIDDRLLVAYAITPGPLAEVGEVRIVGFERPGLERVLLTRVGTPLQETLLAQDERALQRLLADDGYSEARVEADAPEGGGAIPVVFRVRPGPRTLMGGVSVETADASPAPGVALRARPGAPYRARDVAADRAALLLECRESGQLDARVAPELRFAPDRSMVEVLYRVDRGPRTVVEHVVVAGIERTREEVVRRELTFGEGSPLVPSELLRSQRQLASVSSLQRAQIRELDGGTPLARNLVVAAEEAARTAVSYAVGYSERDLARVSVEVTRRNLQGLDRSLSTFGRISFRGNRLLGTYREPRLLGGRRELFVTAFREEEDRDEFDYIRYGGLLQSALKLRPSLNLILRYAYQETRTFNVTVPPESVDRQFLTSTFSGPSLSLVRDTRDDPLDSRRGAFLGADFQWSWGPLGGDSFAKAFLQASRYRPLHRRLLLALNARVGLARTFRDEPERLPLPDRFFLGGDYGLRGFEVDGVDKSGGNGLLFGGVELRVDAGRRIELAAFGETGAIYPLTSDMRLSALRYTAGLGLRYKSAFGPLRLDWGYKLDRLPGEKPYHVHFTVGHAF
jgi:outer membrane protein insertion porin family